MFALFFKEVNSFLNSLIGYVVIIVFLLTIGLFMWVFPGTDFNVLNNGYAAIDPLFIMAPWVFMFLIPAITMRTFAEEKKTGTIEILFTRPLTELQIIFAKYLSGLVLVIFSLLPTLVYYYSVSQLGSPPGNIDEGGMWGSYIGLLFLGSGYVAIGIFASSITDNQIIAFITAVFLCFIVYIGFSSISSLSLFGRMDYFVELLGIQAHYVSMSRGVLDSRDVIYFLSLTGLFIFLTKIALEARKW
ncbi:MAG: gliding motility-associated ABC transporter permease subunit GldF [Bacteroidia bacterium]